MFGLYGARVAGAFKKYLNFLDRRLDPSFFRVFHSFLFGSECDESKITIEIIEMKGKFQRKYRAIRISVREESKDKPPMSCALKPLARG